MDGTQTIRTSDDGLILSHVKGGDIPIEWADIQSVSVTAEQFSLGSGGPPMPVLRLLVVDYTYGEFVELPLDKTEGIAEAIAALTPHLEITVDDPMKVLRTIEPGADNVKAVTIARRPASAEA